MEAWALEWATKTAEVQAEAADVAIIILMVSVAAAEDQQVQDKMVKIQQFRMELVAGAMLEDLVMDQVHRVVELDQIIAGLLG